MAKTETRKKYLYTSQKITISNIYEASNEEVNQYQKALTSIPSKAPKLPLNDFQTHMLIINY